MQEFKDIRKYYKCITDVSEKKKTKKNRQYWI